MIVSKEFWVSDEHLDKIHNNKEFVVILRNKDESSFHDAVINKAVNKITISYEIDREVTIKESDFEKILEKLHIANNELTERAIGRSLRYELFGGGENE